MSARLRGVLFDKDGTLLDFAGTWNNFARRLLTRLAAGDELREARLAAALRFDRSQNAFMPDSPAIAGTNAEVARLLATALPGNAEAIETIIETEAARVPVLEAVPLVPLLAGLAARDLSLGVMTNDSETVARAHLDEAGVRGMFDVVAGADSGFGAKPDPAPLLACARAMRLAPHEIVMVGDSAHDLRAGRAAGMACVGVLTGPADAETLQPLADAVLPDIGHLPDWLDRMG